jgi:hypothetical protein
VAKETCQVNGWKMAQLETIDEYNLVRDMHREYFSLVFDQIFVGGEFSTKLNQWVWHEKQDKISYDIPWGFGYPARNTTKYDCLIMAGYCEYRFINGRHDEKHVFLCEASRVEMNPVPLTSTTALIRRETEFDETKFDLAIELGNNFFSKKI